MLKTLVFALVAVSAWAVCDLASHTTCLTLASTTHLQQAGACTTASLTCTGTCDIEFSGCSTEFNAGAPTVGGPCEQSCKTTSAEGSCYQFAKAVEACVVAHGCALDCYGDSNGPLAWNVYQQFAPSFCTALNTAAGTSDRVPFSSQTVVVTGAPTTACPECWPNTYVNDQQTCTDCASGSSTATFVGRLNGATTCVQHTCAAYTFGTGVVGGTSDPCNGSTLTLTESSTCTVKCDVGYEAQEATISCAAGADQGAALGWTTTTPLQCVLKTCAAAPSQLAGYPFTPATGAGASGVWNYGETLTATVAAGCTTGFSGTVSAGTYTCAGDNTWTQVTAANGCTAQTCTSAPSQLAGYPFTPATGAGASGVWNYGETLTATNQATCTTGFSGTVNAGSYTCAQGNVWTENTAADGCSDVNGCTALDSNGCGNDAHATCGAEGVNTRTCTCATGTTGTATLTDAQIFGGCSDVDGCTALNSNGCGNDAYATCGAEGVNTRTCTCATGTTGTATLTDAQTFGGCTSPLCQTNEYVSSNQCQQCALGKINAASDDATGEDTTCECAPGSLADGEGGCTVGQCGENEYVAQNNYSCVECPPWSSNEEGDITTDPSECDGCLSGTWNFVLAGLGYNGVITFNSATSQYYMKVVSGTGEVAFESQPGDSFQAGRFLDDLHLELSQFQCNLGVYTIYDATDCSFKLKAGHPDKCVVPDGVDPGASQQIAAILPFADFTCASDATCLCECESLSAGLSLVPSAATTCLMFLLVAWRAF